KKLYWCVSACGIQQLVAKLSASHNRPASRRSTTIPDQRLARNADQQWSNSVPVPLDPDVLTKPLLLSRPKPDMVFGYSEAAFNHKQLMTIDLLVDDKFERSYAVLDQKLRFPFLDIDC